MHSRLQIGLGSEEASKSEICPIFSDLFEDDFDESEIVFDLKSNKNLAKIELIFLVWNFSRIVLILVWDWPKIVRN